MAGQHDNMLCMIHDYDTGAPIHSNDVHCAATLIKVILIIILYYYYFKFY